MADTKRGKDGMLGPYRLGRRHGSKGSEMEEPGRLYEAHNVHTDAPALVLVPGPGECGSPKRTGRYVSRPRPGRPTWRWRWSRRRPREGWGDWRGCSRCSPA